MRARDRPQAAVGPCRGRQIDPDIQAALLAAPRADGTDGAKGILVKLKGGTRVRLLEREALSEGDKVRPLDRLERTQQARAPVHQAATGLLRRQVRPGVVLRWGR